MADELKWIPIDQLVDPPVVLRLVQHGSVAYMELRDSIADRGLLNPILVRPSARVPDKYDVVDGLYRVTCCREVRRSPVPCLVKDLTDDDLLAIQIQANALRPETTPMEYARQIKKIMDARPQATLAEISSSILHKGPKWIGETLGLLCLRKDFQTAVDRGEMPLGCAYELARIPYKHQAEFFDAARTMPVAEFRATAQAFLKRFQEAVRQGKLDAFFTEDFKPVAYMHPLKQVVAELEKPTCAALVLVAERCKTLTDAWRAALAWVLHLDRESLEVQRQAVMNRSRKRAKEALDKQP
jgi:ParB/RepB/Spo0J family partition protein